jgi:hypothetical protein
MGKSATRSQTRSTNIYPAANAASQPINSSSVIDGSDSDLVGLVWKHFQEEIDQALQETHQALASAQNGSLDIHLGKKRNEQTSNPQKSVSRLPPAAPAIKRRKP